MSSMSLIFKNDAPSLAMFDTLTKIIDTPVNGRTSLFRIEVSGWSTVKKDLSDLAVPLRVITSVVEKMSSYLLT
jgi:hypothetical protein